MNTIRLDPTGRKRGGSGGQEGSFHHKQDPFGLRTSYLETGSVGLNPTTGTHLSPSFETKALSL